MQGKNKKDSISYMVGYIEEDDCKLPKFKNFSFSTQTSKRYVSSAATKALFNLDPCSRNLIDYLVQKMPDNNYAKNDEISRLEFIKYCKNCAGIDYKDDTVKSAFSKLSKAGVLLRTQFRGQYQVNPLYFFNGTDAKRKQMIKILKIHNVFL